MKESIGGWVHLTTVANEIEYGLIAGLLETAGIPANMRAVGVDRFVGAPMAGMEVLVPADRYEEALEMINAEVDEKELEAEELDTENEPDEEAEDIEEAEDKL